MRGLFVDNHRFARDGGGRVFSESGFPASLWDRYLSVFDRMTVVAREAPWLLERWPNDFVVSSREGVHFELVDGLEGTVERLVRRRRALQVLEANVEAADGVILRGTGGLCSMARAIAERRGTPWAIEVVASPGDALWNHGTLAGKLWAPIAELRAKRTIRDAPFALYVTKTALQRRYPNRGGYVSFASNVAIPDPTEDVLCRRFHRIRRAPEPFVLGTVGSLAGDGRLKGIDTALEALARVRDHLPPWEYRVLGPGDPAALESLATELGVGRHVRFQGTLARQEEVLGWLDDVDLYLQPSRREGLPRALVEAMSRGCPALGSRCAGIPELLPESCLTEPGDPEGLAGLIARGARDRRWRRARARAGWEVSREYGESVLEGRRARFWAAFAGFVRRSQGVSPRSGA